MTIDTFTNRPAGAVPDGSVASDGSYLDWPAILAGGVFALALSALLIGFGASLGLSLTSPYRGEGVSASWLAIAAGIWFIWVTVSAFGAGGYLTGRMRRRAGDATPDEVSARDGAHGLLVWATGALFGMVVAATGVSGVLGVGSAAVGSVTDVAADVASSDYFANVLLRDASFDGADGTAEADPALDTPAAEATEALDDTPAAGASETAGTATDTATGSPDPDATSIDPGVRSEIASILARSVSEGELVERDRTYLARLIAANSDLDQAAATERVDTVMAEIDDARADALALVEDARVTGVVVGFISAATLLIGAIAAFFASVAGGHHRDEGLGMVLFSNRR